MDFIRVYLQNDGNIKRGAISEKETGKLIPDKKREVWFCLGTKLIMQKDDQGVSAYTTIQGDPSFTVRFFNDHFERKTFDEISGYKKHLLEEEDCTNSNERGDVYKIEEKPLVETLKEKRKYTKHNK